MAEPDPAARVVLLKRTYTKYDTRGALEARLSLQVADCYLALQRPELVAYFLAQAIESAHERSTSDHLWCGVSWARVGGLLDTVRVTPGELERATAALRRLGHLPEPADGSRFSWIDEQWSRSVRWDDSTLVAPKPRRVDELA